ncbi:MAG: ferrochelatase [Alphaproteobacteria bacterium]|nr:ferrochelatase [Alphaproteobacteria bacterium]OJV46972.1 MAG: ferrochelatase [Alphaproteobacteria bacterium 43-37]
MKYAVVIMNLGGPDSLDSVKPFLFNLFADRAIINLPTPFRLLLAWLISTRRTKEAAEIYHSVGGKSPLLTNTLHQQNALELALKKLNPKKEVKVFVSMRYWHPMAEETARQVKDFDPDQIILLPLYPHFSTTTTLSSFDAWDAAATTISLHKPTRKVCCYPTLPGFIDQNIANINEAIQDINQNNMRILFSAHGLPQRVVNAGDPYAEQVQSTVVPIVVKLGLAPEQWEICYQSRVGPLKWLEPSTADAISRAAREKRGIVIVPISFVSEHSETLYELDQQYAELAEDLGAPFFRRALTVQDKPIFIKSLAALASDVIKQISEDDLFSNAEKCTNHCVKCPRLKKTSK